MMVADRFGNELNVGDQVVVIYDHVIQFEPKLRTGTLMFITDEKKTAMVKYPGFKHTLSINKSCVVLASDPNVSMLVLQL